MNNKNRQAGEIELGGLLILFLVIVVLFGGIGGCSYFYPQYNVYAQRKAGEALLAHAQSAKEVAVAEARAKMESAELLANAEVSRAKGVAAANKIIGDSLKENEAYLRYLYIQALENKQGEVIYVPTEAGLPILEAGRFSRRNTP